MAFTKSAPETFLSLSQVARKADISYPTALKLLSEKKLIPDARTSSGTWLFKASRWDELRRILRENLYHYGAHYVRVQYDAPDHPLNLAADFR